MDLKGLDATALAALVAKREVSPLELVEETIARIEAMPWSPRAKEMMQHALRSGRLPGVTPDPDALEDDELAAEIGGNPDCVLEAPE